MKSRRSGRITKFGKVWLPSYYETLPLRELRVYCSVDIGGVPPVPCLFNNEEPMSIKFSYINLGGRDITRLLKPWARLFMDSAEGKPRIRTAHEGTYKIPKPKTHHQDPNAFMSTLDVLGVGLGFVQV